jgi:hypothetical protein
MNSRLSPHRNGRCPAAKEYNNEKRAKELTSRHFFVPFSGLFASIFFTSVGEAENFRVHLPIACPVAGSSRHRTRRPHSGHRSE